MQNGGGSGPVRPALSRRTKLGIGATVATLVVLVYPGQMLLPVSVFAPLMPHKIACGSIGVGIFALAFFALAFLISCALIGIGIVAVVAVIQRRRIGLVGAALLNAVAISLMLMLSFEFSPRLDPGVFGLDALFAVCAVIPATALVSLLSRTVFRSWWGSGRPFVATAVAAGLLLLPGVAGTVNLGYQLSSTYASQPAATGTSASQATC
jgi:hypothetical protein